MMRPVLLVALLARALAAQQPIRYTIAVDPADTMTIRIEMSVPSVRDSVRVAMATHDEYDDKFWRYVRDIAAENGGAAKSVSRVDSQTWCVRGVNGEVVIRYRIALPPLAAGHTRDAWKPFVSANGALLGGIDNLMYVEGRANESSTLSIDVPKDWRLATGLEPTNEANTFRATNAAILLDSPILAGPIREWRAGATRIAFLPSPRTVPFDTAALAEVVKRITDQAIGIFGGPPFTDYVFLLMDGTGLTLEHWNSLVLGVNSEQLAKDPAYYSTEFAHEFFHTWNLIRLHPRGLRQFRAEPTPHVAELWWSEGMTIYFADEILLRAALYPAGQTRATRLATRIGRYLTNPGYTHISPQRASMTVNSPPGVNGDYSGDYYLTGQLIGDLLELTIRDSTKGARGMDQVMTKLFFTHTSRPGYEPDDIQHAADSACGCKLDKVFADHVRDAKPIDFAPALATIGYQMNVAFEMAKDPTGNPIADTRVYVARANEADSTSPLLIGITRPAGAWAAAGLHSGDQLLTIDGRRIASWDEFRAVLRGAKVGQTLAVAYSRDGVRREAKVLMDVYVVPHVTLTDLPNATPAQLARRAKWLAAQ
jgi:predicted metalloprotease with PDZ domain